MAKKRVNSIPSVCLLASLSLIWLKGWHLMWMYFCLFQRSINLNYCKFKFDIWSPYDGKSSNILFVTLNELSCTELMCISSELVWKWKQTYQFSAHHRPAIHVNPLSTSARVHMPSSAQSFCFNCTGIFSLQRADTVKLTLWTCWQTVAVIHT